MRTLAIDIETYSSNDLKTGGVYKYVEAHDFTILMIAYSIDGGDVALIDLENDGYLSYFCDLLADNTVTKTAFNAMFERVCLNKFFGFETAIESWECTVVKSAMLGLPLHLDGVAKVLKLDDQKDAAGKALIRYFSIPCKPTKANGMRTRNLPEHAPEKWQSFKDYCVQDVRTELAIRDHISWFKIPESEQKLYILDQQINDRGIEIDINLINGALALDALNRDNLIREAIEITGLDNPNSGKQLTEWLNEFGDREVTTLRKEDVSKLLKNSKDENVSRVLEIRQELSKTSIKKYKAMLAAVCTDGRIRGIHQFFGANRTGRWAGRLFQPQNLPRIVLNDWLLDAARNLVINQDLRAIEMLYVNTSDVLSQLIRTALVASNGSLLCPVDFSAIEARVIAWLANEKWRLEVFATHGKIYEASASQMFRVPLESIDKGSPLRQRGKVAELALGYQGGPNALVQMDIGGAMSRTIIAEGKLKFEAGTLSGFSDWELDSQQGYLYSQLDAIKDAWRQASPNIVKLWYAVQDAAIKAIETGETVTMKHLSFKMRRDTLFITLPSGRKLAYKGAILREGKFNRQAIYYYGINDKKQWALLPTYGGKLVENIVQAIARDCLAVAMLRLDDAGLPIIMHVHDEVVSDVAIEDVNLVQINEIMSTPIEWADGLILTAESYTTKYYKKD